MAQSKPKAGAKAPDAPVSEYPEIAVDTAALGKWQTLRYIRTISDPDSDDFAKIDAGFGFVEAVCGMDEDAVVEACGGADATTEAVMGFVAHVIRTCYPKG